MKVFSKPVQEGLVLSTVLIGMAYFASSKRMISRFDGANAKGLLLSGTISTASILAIEHKRFQNDATHGFCNLITKCWLVGTIALFLPLPAKLLKNRVTLSLKPSIKLGAFNIWLVVVTHSIFSILDNDETVTINPQYKLECHPLQIKIEIDRKDLKANPRKHLQHLAEAMQHAHRKALEAYESNPFIKPDRFYPQFKLSFIAEPVADLGGGSREYLDDLFQALSKDPRFQTGEDNVLALPQLSAPISPEDQTFFEQLGQVLMAIHQIPNVEYSFNFMDALSGVNNTNYYIGHHFDNALFAGALVLTAEEIDTPYDELPIEIKLKMAQALLHEDEHAIVYKNMIRWIQNFASLSARALDETDKTLRGFGHNPTPETRLQLLQKTFLDSPKGDLSLAPLHAIAKGMKSLSFPPNEDRDVNHYWNEVVTQETYLDFSEKVQGSLDRQEIASCFVLDESLSGAPKQHIEERVTWMKEWIEHEATELELKQLLKFQTGSSSCPPEGVFIKVHAQGMIDRLMGQERFVPIPNVSTCEFMMRLSPQRCGDEEFNDWTKNGFIECLKTAISGENPFSSM